MAKHTQITNVFNTNTKINKHTHTSAMEYQNVLLVPHQVQGVPKKFPAQIL